MSSSDNRGRVAGLVAVVTGAGGAIGRTIAHTLFREGACVAVVDINMQTAQNTIDDAKKTDGLDANEVDQRMMAVACDVADEKQVIECINSINDKWQRLDVVVNNAAAFVFGKLEYVSMEDWDKVFGVNVRGYASVIKQSLPLLRKSNAASIINMASISSFVAQSAFTPYNTSKGAILQLSRCVAMDYGPESIRCNTLCPGTIDTPATAKHADLLGITKAELVKDAIKDHFLKRLGTTQDVANAVLFLASSESAFMTGTHMVLDGGYLAH